MPNSFVLVVDTTEMTEPEYVEFTQRMFALAEFESGRAKFNVFEQPREEVFACLDKLWEEPVVGDKYDAYELELWVAEGLAEVEARDLEALALYLPREHLGNADLLEAFAEAMIEQAAAELGRRKTATLREGPRSVIAQMIDQACGVHPVA